MQQDTKAIGHASRAAGRAMNRLIVACNEDILAAEDATRAVRDPGLGERLHDQARQRMSFVNDLGRAVVAVGGRPATKASAGAWGRSIARHLRALVAGWNEGDGYAAVADAETRTARAYVDALAGTLPEDARFGVKRQLAQIEADLDDARRMRGLH